MLTPGPTPFWPLLYGGGSAALTPWNGNLALSGDAAPGALLLSGDAQSGTDHLKLSGGHYG